MNELLTSIRADLLSRRMLPLVAVVVAALVAAAAYAMTGGGKVAPSAGAIASSTLSPSTGTPMSAAAQSTTAADAEIPAGVQYQTKGSSRDPFEPLPGSSTGSSSSTSTASAAAAGKSAGSTVVLSVKASPSPSSTGGSSGSGSGSPKPSGEKPRALTPEPLVGYSVSALFGLAPANPGETPTLTPYEDMKRFEPLPSAKAPLLVFAGVLAKHGPYAVFALIAPPILRGGGSCYPSATHCQAIELAAGKSEELEYVKQNGETVALELKVVTIVKQSSVTGAAKAKSQHISRAGRRALRRTGLPKLG
jgi:hypothetical protein